MINISRQFRSFRGIVVLLFALICLTAEAAELTFKPLESAPGVFDLYLCEEATLGIQMLCNKHWKQELDTNAVLFTLNEDPAVLLTVSRFSEIVTGVDELTPERIKKLGQYADGFKIERLKVGRDNAIKVQGESVGFPEVYLLDLYIVHDYKLYGFLFSVNPKDELTNYSVLFQKIIDSIQILKNES